MINQMELIKHLEFTKWQKFKMVIAFVIAGYEIGQMLGDAILRVHTSMGGNKQ